MSCHYVFDMSKILNTWMNTQPLAQITSQSPYYLPKRTWSPTRGPAEGRRKLRKTIQAKNKAALCIVALRCCGFWDFVSVCHWLFLKSWILNRRHWGWWGCGRRVLKAFRCPSLEEHDFWTLSTCDSCNIHITHKSNISILISSLEVSRAVWENGSLSGLRILNLLIANAISSAQMEDMARAGKETADMEIQVGICWNPFFSLVYYYIASSCWNPAINAPSLSIYQYLP